MTAINFPARELKAAVNAAITALAEERPKTLQSFGSRLLSFERQSYDEKAAGRTGADGISWKPLTVATILSRLRKAGHLKSQSSTELKAAKKLPAAVPVTNKQRRIHVVIRTVKENAALFTDLASAGVKFHNKKGKRLTGGDHKHRAGTFVSADKATRSKPVTISSGGYLIGIDTGQQRDSSQPGYQGTDGKGGNIEGSVSTQTTVGYGRSYSKFFDQARPLFPAEMPEKWQQELEELAAEQGAKIVQDVFKNRGVS